MNTKIYKRTETETCLAHRIFLDELSQCENFPKYFEIEPADFCNAKCLMCKIGRNEGKSSGHTMTMDVFENIVEQMKPYTDWIEMVSLVGRGESLLDQTLELKIKKLREIGIKQVQLSTNAALLDENRVIELLDSGLNDLRISIDSIRKDIYEKIRGLSFEKVIGNIEKAIQIRNSKYPNIPIRIRAVELEENVNERREWLDFWNDRLMDIDVAQFMPYVANQKGMTSGLQITYPCISVFSTMVIRYGGGVDLCCVDYSYGERDWDLGNILDSSIVEIWRGEIFQKIRRMHLNGNRDMIPLCKGCIAWTESK